MEVLAGFKADLGDLKTVDDLRERFSSDIRSLGYHGFDAFTVKSGTTDNADQKCNLFVCDYGIDLPRSYVRDGWLQMDPVVAMISRTSKPFDYVDFLRKAQKNTSVAWQLGVLRLKGVRRAWLVPQCTIGHMRGMTVYMKGNKNSSARQFLRTGDEIHLLCIEFMENFVKISDGLIEVEEWFAGGIDKASISQRETDCLHWAARGKSNWEIGEILIISENTVRYHLKNVFVKLHANTRSSAVSRAVNEGIIEL